MSKPLDARQFQTLCEWLVKVAFVGIGIGGISVGRRMAKKYASNAAYPTPESRIDALIQHEFWPDAIEKRSISYLFGPKGIPVDIVCVCVHLAQRVAAIALLAGKTLDATSLNKVLGDMPSQMYAQGGGFYSWWKPQESFAGYSVQGHHYRSVGERAKALFLTGKPLE